MTGFELAIMLLGMGGLAFLVYAVQYMGKILTNHLERVGKMNERMMLELMRCNDRLLAIQESLQKPDKN